MRLLLFISILYLPIFTNAQPLQKNWGIEVSTGTDLGWWIYNRGFANAGSQTNAVFGRDYTHHSVTLSAELDALYRINKWTFGLGLGISWLFEDQMIGQQDSEFNFDRDPIAETAVRFQTYSAQIEYNLISKKRYVFSPNFRYGFFDIHTIHPDRENFGSRTFWELGFNQSIRFEHWDFIFRPRYRLMTMKPKEASADQEEHKIYNIGLQFGIRLWL